ncbi:MAG: hypothetical protein JWL87_479 [Candidatus Adlerbacteria bacterium]|nr:hypothetical protein [Candidatus Adlerbacteria bacterium]
MFVFIFFVVGILLGGLVVIFALQNAALVTVSFFNWQLEGSLSLILLVATFAGILIAFLIVLPESVSGYFKYRKLRKENARLEDELSKQKELTHFARKTAPTPEAIAEIEQGAIEDRRVI